MARRTAGGGRRKARSMANKSGIQLRGALLIMRQVQLLPLLPHHALATEQRFGIRVPYVQPSAVRGPR